MTDEQFRKLWYKIKGRKLRRKFWDINGDVPKAFLIPTTVNVTVKEIYADYYWEGDDGIDIWHDELFTAPFDEINDWYFVDNGPIEFIIRRSKK